MSWLYAFGVEGAVQTGIEISMDLRNASKLNVTRYFCELDPKAGKRTFDIELNGRTVELRFSPGKAFAAVSKTYTIPTDNQVSLKLVPAASSAPSIINRMLITRAE